MITLTKYFKDPANLEAAFIHRSYCQNHPGSVSNERLEFLGDSILSAVISDRLYHLFPDLPEGQLTGRRSQIVCTDSLTEKAQLIGLSKQLKLSHGEEESGGRQNPSLLANTFEAVLGAIYLDSGLSACQKYLQDIFPDREILEIKVFIKDPKSLLQEKSQSLGWGTPIYETISSTGPDHAKSFTVEVSVNDKKVSSGSGHSKQRAEIEAARACLAILFPQ